MAYDPIGLVCVVLSLITNVAATGLIGYKTWYMAFSMLDEYLTSIYFRVHRRTMKHHQVRGKMMQSRALSTLMLIAESGVVYCLLWVCIYTGSASLIYSELISSFIAYQIVIVSYAGITLKISRPRGIEAKYIGFMSNFVSGCLVPLIVSIPTSIYLV